MDRQQLIAAIADLDRRLNAEIARNPIPRSNGPYRAFPSGNWVAAFVFIGAGLFGGAIPQLASLHASYGKIVLIIGALLLPLALFRTLMHFLFGRRRDDKKYGEATAALAGLQAQRKELQMQLAVLEKK